MVGWAPRTSAHDLTGDVGELEAITVQERRIPLNSFCPGCSPRREARSLSLPGDATSERMRPRRIWTGEAAALDPHTGRHRRLSRRRAAHKYRRSDGAGDTQNKAGGVRDQVMTLNIFFHR